ncbi:hypothetical protein GOODEAATRI_010088, partial [Goodea atripinnis]
LRMVMTFPPCLGVDHLREALSDHACSNCSVLPQVVRLARLSSVEQAADWAVSVQQDPLLLGQAVALPKRSAADVPLASGRRAKRRRPLGLSTRVDQLLTELAQMKTVLQSLRADGGCGETSPPKQGGSLNCEDDAILAPVVSANASLIVPPDEVLRPNVRCPQPQCHVTDDLHCRAYNSGAWMGRIGNSLSHQMLGLSSSLESVPLDQSTQGLLDTSMQAFALMTLELRRTLSTLVHAQRQVWLRNHP